MWIVTLTHTYMNVLMDKLVVILIMLSRILINVIILQFLFFCACWTEHQFEYQTFLFPAT